jgi:hypothetical protein
VGAADVEVAVDGEVLRLKLGMRWRGDSAFVCDFYAPWGRPVASIVTDEAGGTVTAGEGERRYRFGERFGELAGLGEFPFTFGELVRILSGQYQRWAGGAGVADSVATAGGSILLCWHSDSLATTVERVGRGCRARRCTYHRAGESAWTLTLARFEAGLPREADFRTDERNYFRLRYHNLGPGRQVPPGSRKD